MNLGKLLKSAGPKFSNLNSGNSDNFFLWVVVRKNKIETGKHFKTCKRLCKYRLYLVIA